MRQKRKVINVLGRLTNTIQGVVNFAWPMVLISVVILVSFRLSYLFKNKEKLVLYKELLGLSFVIYILCLFQVVTFQDNVSWSSNNFIPFREMFRYNIGSRLFVKNVLGNALMFLPYGFFDDLADVGNLISSSSSFSKPSLDIWKFLLHMALKASMQDFKHALTRIGDECDFV